MRRKLQRLSLFVVSLWLCGLFSGLLIENPSLAAGCPPPEGVPDLRIVVESAQPVLRHDLAGQDLAALARQDGRPAPAAANAAVLGLTTVAQIVRYDLTLARVPAAGGRCAALQSAVITVAYENAWVFVDRAYPKASCGFQSILKHEKKHVEINDFILRSYVPTFDSLARRMSNDSRLRTALFEVSDGAAEAQFRSRLQQHLEPLLARLDEQRRSQHARLDRAESNRQILARCAPP